MQRDKRRFLHVVVAQAVLMALSLVFALPFIWMLSTSLKVPDHIQSDSVDPIPKAWFLPRHGRLVRVRPLGIKQGRLVVQWRGGAEKGKTVPIAPRRLLSRPYLDWHNYVEGFQEFPFLRYLGNTLVICALSVLGTVLSCSLVAYGLACVPWKGRETLFWVMLSTMMIPGQVTMIPLFILFRHLGWINTILPLVVPTFFGNAFFIFLLRQFYRGIPVSLLEAARVDGAGDLRIWARIVAPLSKPALLMVALFTFINSWNDFLNPLIYLLNDRKYTLSIGLTMFQGQYNTEWGPLMAMSLVMALPIIVLFFLTQKTFIQGVKLSGVKG